MSNIKRINEFTKEQLIALFKMFSDCEIETALFLDNRSTLCVICKNETDAEHVALTIDNDAHSRIANARHANSFFEALFASNDKNEDKANDAVLYNIQHTRLKRGRFVVRATYTRPNLN